MPRGDLARIPSVDRVLRDDPGLVSRGELVEIGAGFRLPDVMRSAGVRLVEVGSTSKPRAADYAGGARRAQRLCARHQKLPQDRLGNVPRPEESKDPPWRPTERPLIRSLPRPLA